MKVIRIWTYSMLFFTTGLLLFSCGEHQKRKLAFENSEIPKDEKAEKAFGDQGDYDKLIQKIDNSKSNVEVLSLEYEDAKSNRAMVRGLLDKQKSVVKLELEESFENGMVSTTHYYFTGGALFYAKQQAYDYNKAKNGYLEIISYFGSNHKIIYSASKIADTEEDLQSMAYYMCKKTDFDAKRAIQIINQKGPYETRFQGSLETEVYKFLIVGTSGINGQKTAIAYTKSFPLAEEMVKNESKYRNKKLRVEFTRVTEINNFTYQGLSGIKLINE